MIEVSCQEFRQAAIQLCMKMGSSDGQFYTLGLVPGQFTAFWFMESPRRVKEDVFETFAAVAAQPMAILFSDLNATDKTEGYRSDIHARQGSRYISSGHEIFLNDERS